MDKTLPNNTKALFEMIMENGDPFAGMRDRMWKHFDSNGKMKNGRTNSAEPEADQADAPANDDLSESTQTEEKPRKTRDDQIKEGDLRGLMERLTQFGMTSTISTGYSEVGELIDCISSLSMKSSEELDDEAFRALKSLTLTLILILKTFIEKRLCKTADLFMQGRIPQDLITSGSLERMERLGSFYAKMATAESRVSHLRRLDG